MLLPFVFKKINNSSKYLIIVFVLIVCNVAQLIETGFDCSGKSPGFYADDSPSSGCSIYHRCNLRGRKSTFKCPDGTLFRQQFLVCAHAHEVNCELSRMYYSVNSPREKPTRQLTLTSPVETFTETSDNNVAQVETTKTLKIQQPLIVLNQTRFAQEPRSIVRINKITTPLVQIPNIVRINKTKLVTSTQKIKSSEIKFPSKINYLSSNLPINPSCPLCEPFFLKNGSCSPCIIIK